MSGAFADDTPAVIGTYLPGTVPASAGALYRLFHRFVRYERFRLAVAGLGAAAAGIPWLASGASFAYRKDAFTRRGGFAGLHHSLSGDDDLLVQRIRRETGLSIGIMPDAEAAVETESPGSFREFLRQRLRHGSATRFYLPAVKAYLAGYHLSNILLTVSLPVALILGSDVLLGCYAAKVSADLVLFSVGEVRMRRSRDWVWFIPFEFVYLLYSIILSPLGYATRRVTWGSTGT